MWRPFALFPFRLVISMMWKPDWEDHRLGDSSSGIANAAESNAGSHSPGPFARSPPAAADTLSDDCVAPIRERLPGWDRGLRQSRAFANAYRRRW
jgi:hypothetical protein